MKLVTIERTSKTVKVKRLIGSLLIWLAIFLFLFFHFTAPSITLSGKVTFAAIGLVGMILKGCASVQEWWLNS